VASFQGYFTPPREETASLQVANTSKYATQSLRSKSLHETQNPALAVSPPREETGSLQVANTSKYATQSLRSKSLHETQNPALADCDVMYG
jgi:hypothetical protein